MRAQPRPRIEVFTDIADFCQAHGKRHPLSVMLALACCAMGCGDRSDSAIAARVQGWSATAIGRVWHRCAKSGGM